MKLRPFAASLLAAALAASARAQVKIAVDAPAFAGGLAAAPAGLTASPLAAPAFSFALAPALSAAAPAPLSPAAPALAALPAPARGDAAPSFFGKLAALIPSKTDASAATRANVALDPASYQALTGKTLERVRQVAEETRLRLVDVKPGTESTLQELPVDLVPGRYYVAVKTHDGVVLTDYSLRHGGHRMLTVELGLPAPRKLDRDGTPVGGVIFYDDGVVVSGQALRYPDARNAADLARALKKMGFKILEKRSGPIHGPNSSTPSGFDARNMTLGV